MEIAGIICLAVPFLSIGPRLRSFWNVGFNTHESMFYLLAITGLCMCGALLGICLALLFNVDSSTAPSWVMPLIALGNVLGCWLAFSSIPRMTKGAERVRESYGTSLAAGTRLLILRSVDEAPAYSRPRPSPFGRCARFTERFHCRSSCHLRKDVCF
jgi:hypothetical protein